MDRHYRFLKRGKIADVLPLRIDLANPSPAIGWDNRERDSFFSRCDFDLVMALALVHHLAITHNVPLPMIAGTLAGLGRTSSCGKRIHRSGGCFRPARTSFRTTMRTGFSRRSNRISSCAAGR